MCVYVCVCVYICIYMYIYPDPEPRTPIDPDPDPDPEGPTPKGQTRLFMNPDTLACPSNPRPRPDSSCRVPLRPRSNPT